MFVEFDRKRTIYSVLRNVSEPLDTVFPSINPLLKSGGPVITTQGDSVCANALKPIGSSLAVNHVLRMSTQPRNRRLAPIVPSRMLSRIFDSPSLDAAPSPDGPPSDAVRRTTGVSTCSADVWTVCLRCLDSTSTRLQLPTVYYEQTVRINCCMVLTATELCDRFNLG